MVILQEFSFLHYNKVIIIKLLTDQIIDCKHDLLVPEEKSSGECVCVKSIYGSLDARSSRWSEPTLAFWGVLLILLHHMLTLLFVTIGKAVSSHDSNRGIKRLFL
jgi:hypothetical protein